MKEKRLSKISYSKIISFAVIISKGYFLVKIVAEECRVRGLRPINSIDFVYLKVIILSDN